MDKKVNMKNENEMTDACFGRICMDRPCDLPCGAGKKVIEQSKTNSLKISRVLMIVPIYIIRNPKTTNNNTYSSLKSSILLPV